jgi:hypothetical protein
MIAEVVRFSMLLQTITATLAVYVFQFAFVKQGDGKPMRSYFSGVILSIQNQNEAFQLGG